ncbi:MAG TPA: tetratricopeptide repeat protein [Nakamurella sp.]
MSRPNPRPQQAAAMSAAFAGAVDLSALKNRATAAAGPADAGGGAGGVGSDAGSEPQPPSPFVVDVDEATFGSLLQASSQVLVVIDLWASWADPGKPLSAALSKLAAAAGGSWILGRVDVDANPRIAQAFQVQSLPMVIAIAQGQPITEPLTMPLPEPQVKEWISALLDALRDHLPGIRQAEARLAADGGGAAEAEPEPEDPRFVAAEEALASGDYAAAELAYQQILAADPANAEAKAALAQVGLLARVDKLPPDAIAQADAAPDDVELQKSAADAELAAGNGEAAFKRLVDTVRRTSGDDRTAAREHLVELFTLFASDDPEVIKARRALAAALY